MLEAPRAKICGNTTKSQLGDYIYIGLLQRAGALAKRPPATGGLRPLAFFSRARSWAGASLVVGLGPGVPPSALRCRLDCDFCVKNEYFEGLDGDLIVHSHFGSSSA